MLTGFYNVKSLSIDKLKEFYNDVLLMSYYVAIESKYTESNKSSRGPDMKYTIKDYLDMISLDNHNVCVDRNIQHSMLQHVDVGFKLATKYDKDWHQISFYVARDKFEDIRSKYNLIMS
jgi:hypothetical protein